MSAIRKDAGTGGQVMGMFDDLICEAPLPDGHKGSFQTKDFDCTMTKFKITEDGRLLKQLGQYVNAPERRWFQIRWEPGEWVEVPFHGILNFYGFEDDADPKAGWHEYDAKFTDGRLVEVRLHEPAPHPEQRPQPGERS